MGFNLLKQIEDTYQCFNYINDYSQEWILQYIPETMYDFNITGKLFIMNAYRLPDKSCLKKYHFKTDDIYYSNCGVFVGLASV